MLANFKYYLEKVHVFSANTIQYCMFIETTATNLLVFLCGTDLYLDYNVAKLSDFNKIYLKKKGK